MTEQNLNILSFTALLHLPIVFASLTVLFNCSWNPESRARTQFFPCTIYRSGLAGFNAISGIGYQFCCNTTAFLIGLTDATASKIVTTHPYASTYVAWYSLRLHLNPTQPTSRGLSAGSRSTLRASLDPADKPRDVGCVGGLNGVSSYLETKARKKCICCHPMI